MTGSNNSFSIDDQGILRCIPLLQFPWLEHGFETRQGKFPTEGFQAAFLRQIHSDVVVVPDRLAGDCGEGDALVANQPGQLLLIRTADCVPVLLVDPQAKVVSAVHAGWRGVVREVIPRAVEVMCGRFGSQPETMLAAIGPCIRMQAFEVGPEVAMEFRSLFPERDDLHTRCRIDLAEGCVRQLVRLGVPAHNIFDSGHCSHSLPELYYSYRREKEKQGGRMHSFIGIRPEPSATA
jgi:YfiH family protein